MDNTRRRSAQRHFKKVRLLRWFLWAARRVYLRAKCSDGSQSVRQKCRDPGRTERGVHCHAYNRAAHQKHLKPKKRIMHKIHKQKIVAYKVEFVDKRVLLLPITPTGRWRIDRNSQGECVMFIENEYPSFFPFVKRTKKEWLHEKNIVFKFVPIKGEIMS